MKKKLLFGLLALVLTALASLPVQALPIACSCDVCVNAQYNAKCNYHGQVWTCDDYEMFFCGPPWPPQ